MTNGIDAVARLERPEIADLPEQGADGSAERPEGLAGRLRARMYGRWAWGLSLAVIFGLCAGILGWRAGTKVYVGRGQVYVAPFVDDYGFNGGGDRNAQNYDAFVDTQVQFIRTPRVIDRALESIHWRGIGRGNSEQESKEFRENLQGTRKGEIIIIETRDADATAAMTGASAVIQAYEQLNAEEDSQRGKGKLEFLQSELGRSVNKLTQLDAAIKGRLRAQKGYENFGIDDLGPLFAAKLNETSALDGRLREVRRELAMRETRVQRPTTVPSSQPASRPASGPSVGPVGADATIVEAPSPEDIALENSQMAVYVSQRREIENNRRRLAMKYGESHAALIAVENDLETINVTIRDFALRYVAMKAKQSTEFAVVLETDRLRHLEANLAQSSKEANDSLDALTRLKRDIQDLREQTEQEKQNRDDIRKRVETQERLARVPGRIKVLDAGVKPTEPTSDSRPRLAALGGAGGAVLGFASVLLVGLLDGRVRGVDDTRRMGLGHRPMLGVLPQLPDGLAGPEETAEAANCVHRLRTMLQLWYGGMNRPVFAISGPAAGTGKTTLTLALGLSFATSGSRTLLIDFDLVGGGLTSRSQAVRRRRLGQILRQKSSLQPAQLKEALTAATTSGILLGEALVKLGFVEEPAVAAALDAQRERTLGVLDVMEGERLSRCVCRTEHADLHILPLGDARSHMAGTVSPLRMQRLIDAARAEYDVVLIDTGPLPGSLEAAAVVAAVDGVVLVVSRGDQLAGLQQCVRSLQTIGAHVAGVAFNRATRRDLIIAGASSSTSAGAGRRDASESRNRFGAFGQAVAAAGNGERRVRR